MNFPFYKQLDAMDCGPTCLRMVAKHFGRSIPAEYLRQKTQFGKEGTSMLSIADAAESIGLKTAGVKQTYKQLINDCPLPAIIHWDQYHFVVLVSVKKSFFAKIFASPLSSGRGAGGEVITIADPATGIVHLSKEEFCKRWLSTKTTAPILVPTNGVEQKVELSFDNVIQKPLAQTTLSQSSYTSSQFPPQPNGGEIEGAGIALLFEPTPAFSQTEFDYEQKAKPAAVSWGFLLNYLKQHKAYIFQILLGLLIASALQLVFPYLTQSIVDTGINTQNINFIQVILAAQLMLLFSQTVVEFIRSRILLYISTRITVSLLSGFWSKLLKLPLHFFDSKHPGDIMQRINDHHRIESFLTGSALNTVFSFFNILIFSFVLMRYSIPVFIIFAVGSMLYLFWIQLFLRFRRRLDYNRFSIAAKENTATMQLVHGVQEIKLNNAENSFRWAWEGLQAGLFKLNFKNLSLSQYQQVGSFFINQGKNILITFLVAQLVIEGKLSLGMMLAVQYIIGQLNSPIEQLTGFTQQLQDAKISLERLNDIHLLEDEEPQDKLLLRQLPQQYNIFLHNVSFTYPGAGNEPVLKNISLTIPQGKTTAIVGMSGSGKTTILKLLLRFYESYTGEIKIGGATIVSPQQSLCQSPGFISTSEVIEGAGIGLRFNNLSPKFWRSISGAVMQDSYIFNDNIQKNITVTGDAVNMERLLHACKTANILDWIESLPLGFYTKLGAEGHGLSGGQKQRIAIARAVYKNPQFIFFDEATNALDANNEKVILENLTTFFAGKTVVVVAHRLSTVKNADKIVVLENGAVAEEGTHETLTQKKGKYYELVKNQLELGN
jgi:ATP-binding cassette, subfamily B, bacterial